MKNKFIILVISIVIVIGALTGLLIYVFSNKNTENHEFTYLKTINYEEFLTKLENNEEFFVYIGRLDCEDSLIFEREFTKLFVEFKDGEFSQLKYDLDEKPFYYFDVSEIIDSTSNHEQRDQYKIHGFYYTPSLVHYNNGEVVNIAEWSPISDFAITDYMKWFYDTGLVNPYDDIYHQGPTRKN